jgi:pyroglutamyl-peptidase
MTVLITGFEPFGGESVNPSWLTVHRLSGQRILGHEIVGACLPTAFNTSLAQLAVLIEQYRPDLVIALGQAGGRSGISLERIAINIDDARIPDNLGAKPIDLPVIEGAPAAYFSSLPIKAMLKQLHAADIPAEVSNSAGTYVCNHVFYGLMHLCRHYPGMRAGFVHMPYVPEQAIAHPGAPGMALEDIVRAMAIIVRCAIECENDIVFGSGTEC